MKLDRVLKLLREERDSLEHDAQVEMKIHKTNEYKALTQNPFLAGRLYEIRRLMIEIDPEEQ